MFEIVYSLATNSFAFLIWTQFYLNLTSDNTPTTSSTNYKFKLSATKQTKFY